MPWGLGNSKALIIKYLMSSCLPFDGCYPLPPACSRQIFLFTKTTCQPLAKHIAQLKLKALLHIFSFGIFGGEPLWHFANDFNN